MDEVRTNIPRLTVYSKIDRVRFFFHFQVLGIYTFTKRVNQEDAEIKPRKAQGYSTVSHFNIVHIDCHMAAVR